MSVHRAFVLWVAFVSAFASMAARGPGRRISARVPLCPLSRIRSCPVLPACTSLLATVNGTSKFRPASRYRGVTYSEAFIAGMVAQFADADTIVGRDGRDRVRVVRYRPAEQFEEWR